MPAFIPFTFHWYTGADPPLEGVAVKDTTVPSQTGFADAVMDTLTGKFGLTVMVIEFDVAGLPEVQVALEVN